MIRSLMVVGLGLALCAPSALAGRKPAASSAPVTFTVRVENISQGEALELSTGGTAPFAVAPGMWAVLGKGGMLFAPKRFDDGRGLEQLAEDGDPSKLVSALAGTGGVLAAGVYNTPAGASMPGPLTPGGVFEFTVEAAPGSRLALAEMFGQSNDLFYATDPKGVRLFDDKGEPISGDITSELTLWDAGTEMNQEPGLGADQAPRQAGPNTGAPERAVVSPIGSVSDGFTYPRTADVLRVTITPARGM